MIEDTRDHLITFDMLALEASEKRSSLRKQDICTYGMGVLDEFLGGILPSELIVIGADTGMGKSDLAYNVAIKNAKRGKKVVLLALEGDIHEVALRFMQREMSVVEPVNTIEYRFNMKKKHKEMESNIIGELGDWGPNLRVFNKTQIPSLNYIRKLIQTTKETTDLFIIDHLHYIHFGDKRNELEEIGKTMRELKTITDITKKPVVLVSHLRKRTKKDEDPTEYDLYGSSNIAKEATSIILINKMPKSDLWNTPDDIKFNNRYAGTKVIAQKSRIGAPTVSKFQMVYDRWNKDYVEKYSQLIENESQATQDDKIDLDRIMKDEKST